MGRPRKNTPTGRPCSRRFPLDPLAFKSGCAYFDVITRRWVPDWPMLATALGTTREALHKQDEHGGLIANRAEVYACRLGLPAVSVWPSLYDELDEANRLAEEAMAS
jgi:hypothetical protein